MPFFLFFFLLSLSSCVWAFRAVDTVTPYIKEQEHTSTVTVKLVDTSIRPSRTTSTAKRWVGHSCSTASILQDEVQHQVEAHPRLRLLGSLPLHCSPPIRGSLLQSRLPKRRTTPPVPTRTRSLAAARLTLISSSLTETLRLERGEVLSASTSDW